MTKTLIEKMEAAGSPKSWTAEVVAMQLQLKSNDRTIQEYLELISTLAENVDAIGVQVKGLLKELIEIAPEDYRPELQAKVDLLEAAL